jgi:hypothetical protein
LANDENKIVNSNISIEVINNSQSTKWDLGNEVLYKLCKENFYHQNEQQILAKVWLIGRAYAAALERRRNKETINDNFYLDSVVPKFKESNIDEYLSRLQKYDSIDMNNVVEVLQAHNFVTKLTKSITLLDKRSFSSKYLHFHLPRLFFIYDSRVVSSLRQFISKAPKVYREIIKSDDVDTEYAKYVCKCLAVKDEIKQQHGIELTPRQLDNILINIANSAMNKKKI